MVKWRCESAASPAGGQGGDTWGCSDPAAGSGASGRQARRRLEGGCVPRRVRRAGKAASGPVAAVRHAGESAAAGVGASRRVRRASGAVAGVLRWHCGESGVPAGRAFRKLNKKNSTFRSTVARIRRPGTGLVNLKASAVASRVSNRSPRARRLLLEDGPRSVS